MEPSLECMHRENGYKEAARDALIDQTQIKASIF